MNGQERQVVENTIMKLDDTITELCNHKVDIDMRITELENTRSDLMRLLTVDTATMNVIRLVKEKLS